MTYGEVVFMANVEGLQQTLEFIKTNPAEWDQHRWHMCFAGISLRVLKGAALEDSDCCNVCRRLTLDGERVYVGGIAELALEALELAPLWETRLFNACNTLEDLERIVAEISDEEAQAA